MNNTPKYIVRIAVNGIELAACDTLEEALAYIHDEEQKDFDNDCYEEDYLEVYNNETEEIEDLYEYKCDKCGRIIVDKWRVPKHKDFYLCDTCIDETVWDNGDSEYCREKEDTVWLHDWDISLCDNCNYRDKCRVVAYFRDVTESK